MATVNCLNDSSSTPDFSSIPPQFLLNECEPVFSQGPAGAGHGPFFQAPLLPARSPQGGHLQRVELLNSTSIATKSALNPSAWQGDTWNVASYGRKRWHLQHPKEHLLRLILLRSDGGGNRM